MNVSIRREQPEDYRAVEVLTREAFWNVHVPGCDEHYYLHVLRESSDFIRELDFVAELDGRLAGHIAYSRAAVKGGAGEVHPVICLGPVSVLPELQRRGIGSALIRHSLAEAERLGYGAVCIYGDPRYYARFGFRSAEKYGIAASDGVYAVALMALALWPGALSGVTGRFHEFPYAPDEAALAAFDAAFAPKEKAVTESQREFQFLRSLRY